MRDSISITQGSPDRVVHEVRGSNIELLRVVETNTDASRVTGSNNDCSRSKIDSNNFRILESTTEIKFYNCRIRE